MNNTVLITFLRRFVVILIFAVVTMVIAYSCSAINAVSNYHLDLAMATGRLYQSESQEILLSINSEEEAYLHAGDEETGVYKIVAKDNLVYLERGEEENISRTIFVPLDEDTIFWQSKNTYLYYWEAQDEA